MTRLLLLLATFPSFAVAGGIYKVPLKKLPARNIERRLGATKELRDTGELDGYTPLKIGGSTSDPKSIVVNDYVDAAFVADIWLGSPPQEFQVVLDTGSSNLWISNSKPVPVLNEKKMRTEEIRTTYDHAKSSTHVAQSSTFSLAYGNKALSGKFAGDSLHLGGLNISHYVFANVDSRAGLQPVIDRTSLWIDGVFGLGCSESSSVNNMGTPWQALYNSNSLNENAFAFYISTNGDADELVIGGADPNHYTGDFTYQPVIDIVEGKSGFWAMALDDIKLGSWSMTKARKAVIDSGTSLIAMPKAEAAFLANQLSASPLAKVNALDTQYRVECKGSLPDIYFIIGGKQYTLTQEDYVHEVESGRCMLAFVGIDVPAPMGPMIILGDVFLRAHYVKFDVANKRLGFAKVKMVRRMFERRPQDNLDPHPRHLNLKVAEL